VFATNEDLLNAAGASWDRMAGFDARRAGGDEWKLFHHRAGAIVANLDASRPWVMKDPRMCVLFPLWRPLLTSPVGVLVYRNPLDVAASLAARNGFSTEQGLALWATYMRPALAETADLPRVMVSYDDIIAAPETALRRLFTELVQLGIDGLQWPARSALLDFIDASLCHHRAIKSLESELDSEQFALYEALRRGDYT
jgi:hypothetical protein